MKRPPEELASLGVDELEKQARARDDLLAPLFRRWPALTSDEMRRLRDAYRERLTIAKRVGHLRTHRTG
jgi:hypothetical protein